VPYDPTPTSADPRDADGRRTALTVQLQGGDGEPETVLTLDRPLDGTVLVREYPVGAPLAPYRAPVAEVLARVERVARAGRRVSVEPAALRAFLAGHP
jgi:hypothetical protein